MAATLTGFAAISTILDDLKKVYFCANVIDSAEALSGSVELQQLPITEDGVTLNFGAANLTYKKLNTGEVWGSTVDRDDPEVAFNVASVNDTINSMFMGKLAEDAAETVELDGNAYAAQGYASTLEAKVGSLWLPAENGEGWVVLPNVKMYGGLNGTDDSNTAYYAVSVTPQTNKAGASLYLLTKKAA